MAVFALSTFPRIKFALTGLVLVAALSGSGATSARGWDSWSGPATAPEPSIALAEMPAQGQQTYQAILRGGPFRYDKDGSVFGNRERLLPRAPRGHYREYTVETPGAGNRGARRIVCGGEPTAPQACWYTADHYASFRRIVP